MTEPLNSLDDMALHYSEMSSSKGSHDESPHLNRWGLFLILIILEKLIKKFKKDVDKFGRLCYIAIKIRNQREEVINMNEILSKKIKESGLKKKYIISRLGLSYAGFDNKLAGRNEWLNREVDDLCDMLHITSITERRAIFSQKR